MRLGTKFFLLLFGFICLIIYFTFNIFTRDIKPTGQIITEELLVDTANTLANLAANYYDRDKDSFDLSPFNKSFTKKTRELLVPAKIHNLIKHEILHRIYITNQKGIVIFDSETPSAVGQDYSAWNDVRRTLSGEYGARSTKEDHIDSKSTVMYVAAPIMSQNNIVGVLTVAKPIKGTLKLASKNERNIKLASITMLLIIISLGSIFIYWLNYSLKRLENYANQVAQGEKVKVPNMKSPEFKLLAQSLEKMRTELEGKSYIEQYTHTLTHELKSPLAAIKGATEILKENPPLEIQQQFITNISEQTERIQQLIERLLIQAQVENLTSINFSPLNLVDLALKSITEKEVRYSTRNISLSWDSHIKEASILGDPFLLTQIISNLLDNAFDFTGDGDNITIKLTETKKNYHLSIIDEGSGIPEYAKAHIFERFYSLPRPNNKKSTGLGLSFVKEATDLHDGTIEIHDNHPKGTIVTLILPKVA